MADLDVANLRHAKFRLALNGSRYVVTLGLDGGISVTVDGIDVMDPETLDVPELRIVNSGRLPAEVCAGILGAIGVRLCLLQTALKDNNAYMETLRQDLERELDLTTH